MGNTEPYSLAKSFASGFAGGVVFASNPLASLSSKAYFGFLSGIVEEGVSQSIDVMTGKSKGYNAYDMQLNALLGMAAGGMTDALTKDIMRNFIKSAESNAISKLSTKGTYDRLYKDLAAQHPDWSPKDLRRTILGDISYMKKMTRKHYKALEAIIFNTVETGAAAGKDETENAMTK